MDIFIKLNSSRPSDEHILNIIERLQEEYDTLLIAEDKQSVLDCMSKVNLQLLQIGDTADSISDWMNGNFDRVLYRKLRDVIPSREEFYSNIEYEGIDPFPYRDNWSNWHMRTELFPDGDDIVCKNPYCDRVDCRYDILPTEEQWRKIIKAHAEYMGSTDMWKSLYNKIEEAIDTYLDYDSELVQLKEEVLLQYRRLIHVATGILRNADINIINSNVSGYYNNIMVAYATGNPDFVITTLYDLVEEGLVLFDSRGGYTFLDELDDVRYVYMDIWTNTQLFGRQYIGIKTKHQSITDNPYMAPEILYERHYPYDYIIVKNEPFNYDENKMLRLCQGD